MHHVRMITIKVFKEDFDIWVKMLNLPKGLKDFSL